MKNGTNLKKMNIIQQKKMKSLFIIDCSCSVEEELLYHNNFYLSKNKIKEKNCSLVKIKEFNEKLKGYDARDSSFIIKILIDENESYKEHLLIVTDRPFEKSCIVIQNNNIKFTYVTTFIIGIGNNLSVGALYYRDCPNAIYSIKLENERKKN